MPYQRGAGMDQTQAERLADQLVRDFDASAQVEREGHFFVIRCVVSDVEHVLRDAADVAWMRRQFD